MSSALSEVVDLILEPLVSLYAQDAKRGQPSHFLPRPNVLSCERDHLAIQVHVYGTAHLRCSPSSGQKRLRALLDAAQRQLSDVTPCAAADEPD